MQIYRALRFILAFYATAIAQQSGALRPVEDITSEQIVSRLAENNGKRQHLLRSYTGQREYHLLYTGFPGRHEADLVVEVRYRSPDSKEFTVISESGAHWIVNRVFKKILDTEKEAADQRAQASTALTDQNYKFELLGEEDVDGRPAYVFHVDPKTDNRLLYRGRIWVDAADFALCKIEGEPAKRPSMWISKIQVHHSYEKIGDFWLPVDNESDTEVRLGGHAALSIHYRDYSVISEDGSPALSTPAEPAKQAAKLVNSGHSH
jgi:hypothetical protein